tara:strand:- start:1945 stop:2277 length:333 start_codon:yes stop_codon:yes gene_type:complete
MAKQRDLMELLGIPEDSYDPDKERLVIVLEEEEEGEEEFTIRIFDISDDVTEISLIKEIGYGVLSSLYDEDFLSSVREAGKYSFNVKYPQSLDLENYGDNVINFRRDPNG